MIDKTIRVAINDATTGNLIREYRMSQEQWRDYLAVSDNQGIVSGREFVYLGVDWNRRVYLSRLEY